MSMNKLKIHQKIPIDLTFKKKFVRIIKANFEIIQKNGNSAVKEKQVRTN